MKVHHCPESDCLILTFRDAASHCTEPLQGSDHDVFLDYDGEGKLCAMTIQNASQYVANPSFIDLTIYSLATIDSEWRPSATRRISPS